MMRTLFARQRPVSPLTIIGLPFFLLTSVCLAQQTDLPPADATTAKKAEQPAEKESAEIRFAKAHLRVAEMDLQRLVQLQARNPNVFNTGTTDDLKRHFIVDQLQLEQAMKGAEANSHDLYMKTAKLGVEYAKGELKRKQQLHAKYDTEKTKFEVERAKLVVDMAEAQLELTSEKKGMTTSMAYLKWQIEMLRNQVLELQTQVNSKFRRDW